MKGARHNMWELLKYAGITADFFYPLFIFTITAS